MAENDQATFNRGGCLFLVGLAALVLLGAAAIAVSGLTSDPYEGTESEFAGRLPPVSTTRPGLQSDKSRFIDFGKFVEPTIREPLSEGTTSRYREVIVQFGPGEKGLQVAVANGGRRVARGGVGIAARTEERAVLIDNREFLTIERPVDCVGGCIYTFWITMGSSFQSQHPDAELVVYAGEGAAGRLDEVETLQEIAHRLGD